MKNRWNTYLTAILAGAFIGIGGTVWMACDIKYVGAVMFCIGLYTICFNRLWLFTGKVGYLVEHWRNPKAYAIDLLTTWCGNFVGAVFIGVAVSFAKPALGLTAAKIMASRYAQSPIQTIVLAVACGMIMFVAVDAYKQEKSVLGILLGVPTFLLCGFEHSVADMFFVGASVEWCPYALLHILLVSAGNAIGSVAVALVVSRNRA